MGERRLESTAVADCIARHWAEDSDTILFTHCGKASLELDIIHRLLENGIPLKNVYLYDINLKNPLIANAFAGNFRAIKQIQGLVLVKAAAVDRGVYLPIIGSKAKLGMVVACNYQMSEAKAIKNYIQMLEALASVYPNTNMLLYYNIDDNTWVNGERRNEKLNKACTTIRGWSERLKDELLDLYVSNLAHVQFGTRGGV